MNKDITFCPGLTCPKKKQCERWIENAKEYVRISVSDFYKQEPCEYFIEKERENDQSKLP